MRPRTPHGKESSFRTGARALRRTAIQPIKVAISAIFRETVRDIETEEPDAYVIGEDDLWRVVGLHEVAHQFGLDHDLTNDGPIMVTDECKTKPVDELIFSPDGLRQITWRNFPRKHTPQSE